jgi:thiol-disulfide isomerase/thioredoxin
MVKLAWKYFAVSATFAIALIALGFYFGIFLSNSKVDSLRSQLADIQRNQNDIDLELAMITSTSNISCSALSYELDKTVGQASDLGDKVSLYESTERVQSPDFQALKSDYTITLVKYWYLLDKTDNICKNTNTSWVLFFYSNSNCSDCSKQGTILSYIKQQYPNKVMVFALDSNIGLNSVDFIKHQYNITETPSMVINGVKYSGFAPLNDTLRYLQIPLNS